MFPMAPQINQSQNYDKFKFINWNRGLNKPNVQKLIEENRKKFQLHRFPILVTKDFKIIDGQHRYTASKEIGCPIYYIVADDMDESIQSVHSVNKVGKKHSRADKLEMMYKAGDEGAEFVYKTYNLYQGAFDKTTIMQVLSTGTEGGNSKSDIDKHEKVVLRNKEMGLEVLDALFYSSIPDKGKVRTVIALSMIVNKSGVNPKTIVRRTQENLAKWINPKSRQDCTRAFLTCYNYGLKTNRIVMQ
jgi:hypothetical protein